MGFASPIARANSCIFPRSTSMVKGGELWPMMLESNMHMLLLVFYNFFTRLRYASYELDYFQCHIATITVLLAVSKGIPLWMSLHYTTSAYNFSRKVYTGSTSYFPPN